MYKSALFLVVLLSFGSCSKDSDDTIKVQINQDSDSRFCDSQDREFIENLSDRKGIIFYQEDLDKYMIVYAEPNTIDEVTDYIFCGTPENIMEGDEVKFSGKSYRLNDSLLPASDIAGYNREYLKLNSLNHID